MSRAFGMATSPGYVVVTVNATRTARIARHRVLFDAL